ncbi:MAG: choice-of-anchor B family protein [Candidatus Palauibacterales bacterium]|nr:choice-of-anchor B family protein [Candidatus Palauibacterales bacterium]
MTAASRRALLAAAAGLLALALGTPDAARAQGYGASVAASGQDVLVGEPMSERRPGTVYLYRRGSDGTWSRAAEITASDAEAGDHFGRALAAGDGTLWAGATVKDSSTGAAYLFERTDGGEWRQAGRFQPEDLEAEDSFGRTAAVDGDFALISTWGHRDGRGAVYVYRRDSETGEWSQYDKLMADDAASNDYFGGSVAIRDGRALVGAPQKDNQTGAVYVFEHDASAGTWEQTARLRAGSVGSNGRFGSAVHLTQEHLMVGAPGHDSFSGAVFTYEWSDDEGEWQVASRLLPFDGRQGTRFGMSLDQSGGELWVGAPGADGEGRIYRYRRDGASGEWRAATKLSPDGVDEGDSFASTMAIGSGVLVAGLTGDDYGAGTAMILERQTGDEWAAAEKVWSELENYAAVTGEPVSCGSDGQAAHFQCENVDLMSFLPVSQVGGERGVRMSDIWGWTDPETGREYALAGRIDGTAFVDVTDPANPEYLGSLPLTEGANPASWRDIKVYDNHAYIVADNAGDHGIQIFDLTRLRDVSGEPVTFEEDAHYDRVNSVHNLVVNPESGFLYAVGSGAGGETCGGGLHMIDVEEPQNPTFAGCFAHQGTGRQGTGYTHDGQCVIYRGPDEEYRGREICIGANETALSVADVTDKDNPQAISMATYPNVGYAHQGWFGPNQRYFYFDDELDELQGKVDRTRTMVWDMTDLDDPIMASEYMHPTRCSDHNTYVIGDRAFQSNYQCGFTILGIASAESPERVGWFDTVPHGENEPSFGGSWSNYPFFESGNVVVNSGTEGLFVVRPNDEAHASSEALQDAGPVRSAKAAASSGSDADDPDDSESN